MLPMQEPPPPPPGTSPEVNGLDLEDWWRGFWDSVTADPKQFVACLVGASVVVYFMQKAKIPKWVTVFSALGAFWVSWNVYNMIFGLTRPLFPGGFQADRIWEAVWQDGNEGALVIMGIGVVVVLFAVMKTSVHLAWKILIALSFGAGLSFLFNFVDGFRTPEPAAIGLSFMLSQFNLAV